MRSSTPERDDEDDVEHDEGGANTAAGDAAPETSYFYAEAGRPPLGPCTLPQLRVLWVTGHISGTTSVWREGMGKWEPISDFEEVGGALANLRQPPPPPSDLWYYIDGSSRQRGGVSAEQMGLLLRRGEVDGLTSVWRQGMAAWAELASVEELRAQLVRDDDDEEEEASEQQMAAAQNVPYDPDDDSLGLSFACGRASNRGGAVPSASSTAAVPPAAQSSIATADTGSGESKPKRVRKKRPKFQSSSGSNVYVSGLPEEVSEVELAECLKVAGLVRTDPVTGGPKIKLYRDGASGKLKGDAIVSFIKTESVALAVTLRDGFEIRSGRPISVQPAHFEKRDGDGADHAPQRLSKEQSALRKKQRLLEKRSLAEWEGGIGGGKRNSTVILTNLFDAEAVLTEARAAGDAAANVSAYYANLRQDVEVECRKAGEIEKVTIFEASEHGAAAVRFRNIDDAERCVAMLDARQFGTSTVSCAIYDGVTDYRARHLREAATASRTADADGSVATTDASSSAGLDGMDEDGLVQQERNLDAFGDWLEASSTDEELAGDADD